VGAVNERGVRVRVTFIDSKGVARTIEVAPGASVMEAALAQKIPEVQSDCGGACTCAMCHVVVDDAWAGSFAAVCGNEASLLSLLEAPPAHSRLSCQLRLTAEMDGLIIHTLEQGDGP
jgi:2Fe-2S ferredoxin